MKLGKHEEEKGRKSMAFPSLQFFMTSWFPVETGLAEGKA
jgi:hypothetical protein